MLGGIVGLSSTEILFKGGLSWVTTQALPRTLKSRASVSLANSALLLGNLHNILAELRFLLAYMTYLSLDVREVIKKLRDSL